MDYRQAGVDIEAGYESVRLMKQFIARTNRPEVLSDIGGFSGAFSMDAFRDMEEPVLVSGTDGVGTKLKLAFLMDRHDTVGIDCVAMCVNDIACTGGEPLFFLDYIACGKNVPRKIAQIVRGVSEGCVQAGAALIGGETAEMPGFYPEEEYDLAGFAVGVADRGKMITGKEIREGDVLVGIASSGVHSNGYSLVRKVFPMDEKTLSTYHEALGETLGDALLRPTKIYVKGKKAVIDRGSFPVPEIFRMIQTGGNILDHVMFNTFNMGIGMVLALDPADADHAVEAACQAGESAYVIGRIEAGERCAEIAG